jgi:hypothetical protein
MRSVANARSSEARFGFYLYLRFVIAAQNNLDLQIPYSSAMVGCDHVRRVAAIGERALVLQSLVRCLAGEPPPVRIAFGFGAVARERLVRKQNSVCGHSVSTSMPG